jgi:hypothetical protein
MVKCLPGCMPVWRKSMHDKSGLFDENLKYAGDWDMWLRAVKDGSKFLKIDEILGLYYLNPEGLSTNSEKENERFKEEKEIFWSNKETFGQLNFNQFKEYFSREV